MNNCFDGWKKAQEIILLKQLSFWKNNPKFKNNPNQLYWYRNYQRLMDVIIWNHFDNSDLTDMKRIYEWKPLIQNHIHHNIKIHYSLAKQINEDRNAFALITDLTSGIRVGDLFIINSKTGEPTFAEVKEGIINKKILSEIQSKKNNTSSSKKWKKQKNRILKQKQRMKNVLKSLQNKESIEDRFPNHKHETVLIKKPFDTFSEELNKLFFKSKLSKNNIEQVVIEDCLLVLLIKNCQKNQNYLKILKSSINYFSKNSQVGGITFDFNLFLNKTSFTKPIYLQSLERDYIYNLIIRQTIVYFYFCFEKFMNKFSDDECEIKFLTNKQVSKRYGYQMGAFACSKTGSLQLSDINQKMILSGGLMYRLPSFLLKPSHLLYLHKESLKILNRLSQNEQ